MVDFAQLNWFDITLLSIILLSFIFGLMRGLAREIIALMTWIAAFFIAILFTSNLVPYIQQYVKTDVLASVISFLILFVGVLLIGALINFIIGSVINRTGLSIGDRFLGAIFGVARGLLIAVLIIFLVGSSDLQKKPWFTTSLIAVRLQGVSAWIRNQVIEVAQTAQKQKDKMVDAMKNGSQDLSDATDNDKTTDSDQAISTDNAIKR